jgi:UDP-2,4-diacetamido-2,4,6-trideoxy-beta-L-altropyranose hydrolase
MSRSKPFVVVRADASAAIGLGHVMRSLTLARAMVDAGCRVRFRSSGVPARERDRLDHTQLIVEDLPKPGGSANDAEASIVDRPDLVVVDGYHFTAPFFDTLESVGVGYVVIDDNAETLARRPLAVLNQNPHANADLYRSMQNNPTLLLGLNFVLIRPEITAVAVRTLRREPGTVFVAMGGSDPRALTVPIATSLADADFKVRVAIGPATVRRAERFRELTDRPNIHVVDPDAYAVSLATCEIAVLAAGSSLWEAACLKTPTIAVIVAPNQRSSALAADVVGLVDATNPNPSQAVRQILNERRVAGSHTISGSRRSRLAIDGLGSLRVAARLWDLIE